MQIQVAMALSLAFFGAASVNERMFYPLKDQEDFYSFTCPCEFGISYGKPDEGSYGSQELVLMIAPNEKAPFARVNLGKENVQLTPVGSARYECRKGKVYSPKWRTGTVLVSAKLVVEGPGEESCWFDGTLSVQTKEKSNTVRVKGACGC